MRLPWESQSQAEGRRLPLRLAKCPHPFSEFPWTSARPKAPGQSRPVARGASAGPRRDCMGRSRAAPNEEGAGSGRWSQRLRVSLGLCLLAAHTRSGTSLPRAPRGSHLTRARSCPALAPSASPDPHTTSVTPTGAPGAWPLPNHVPFPGGWTTRALRHAGYPCLMKAP